MSRRLIVSRPITARRIRGGLICLALLFAALTLLAGCAGRTGEEPKPLDEPPKVDAEAARREAEEDRRRDEEARLRDEEAKRLAVEEARQAEEQRQKEELMQLFGEIGEVPPPPQRPKPQGIPFDEAVPPLPNEPTVRVAVLSNAGQPEKGRQVALLIGTYHRERLENQLGAAIKIAYVSHLKRNITRDSVIHFRPNFLRAATSVASVLPQHQTIGPMSGEERLQEGVDLFVYIGGDYR